MRVDVPSKRKNEVNIILEEDFIKQPFLKLYATLKGNTNGIKTNHMLTKVGHVILKRRCVVACRCALNKKKSVHIILEEDFIKQPILKLDAKRRGNINGINKPHAAKSATRYVEKAMFCCVSMCLQKEK